MKLTLTLTPDYVNWGIWESIRELMQNGKDADDMGYTMSTSYRASTGYLSIKNDGCEMERRNLLLGGSSKRGDDRQRGQFGEGMKLAWASLLHMGCKVFIRSGDETWKPTIEWSEKFNSNLMVINVGKRKYQRNTEVVVQGISPEDWALIQERLLFVKKPKKSGVIEVDSRRKILTEEKYKNLLYCRGIFVCKLPIPYQYGYDLPVKIDRDRKLADPWDLRDEMSRSITRAVTKNLIPAKEVMRILDNYPNCGEAELFRYTRASYEGSTEREFHTAIVQEFKKKHGTNAVAVSSMSESAEAKHHGLKGIIVPEALRSIFEAKEGKFEEIKIAAATDITKRYGAHEMEDWEMQALWWASNLVEDAEDSFSGCDAVEVVDFVGKDCLGQNRDGKIILAKKVLSNLSDGRKARDVKLISVMVHEVAHSYVDTEDGSVEHRDAIDRIFGKIVVNLQKELYECMDK